MRCIVNEGFVCGSITWGIWIVREIWGDGEEGNTYHMMGKHNIHCVERGGDYFGVR
jgi:hypothetical protein